MPRPRGKKPEKLNGQMVSPAGRGAQRGVGLAQGQQRPSGVPPVRLGRHRQVDAGQASGGRAWPRSNTPPSPARRRWSCASAAAAAPRPSIRLIYSLVSEKEGEPRFVARPRKRGGRAPISSSSTKCRWSTRLLARDLLSFGTKVLVLGDPFQLPPVQGTGFFTADEPDIMLTEIHRQAADNPIIRCRWTSARADYLEHGRYGESRVIARDEVDREAVLSADQVLVGRNKTRVDYNDRLRELKGLPRARAGGRRPARLPAEQPAQKAAQRPDLDRLGGQAQERRKTRDDARSPRMPARRRAEVKVVTHRDVLFRRGGCS